ncbi:MAG: hypothetical protein P1U36_10840, partial [Legionellaceae bacterium]|nr:hypothetical protein [Legionellaceae bacterium]
LKDAVKELNDAQYLMAVNSLELLILLTEGGNKDSIVICADDVVGNIAHRTLHSTQTTSFTKGNPFYPLIAEVARLLPTLQNKYTRTINFDQLYVPQLGCIERYLKTHLRSRLHSMPLPLPVDTTSPIASYLNITLDGNHTVEISRLEGEACERAITENASKVLKVANWLRFHIIIADKIASLNFLFNRRGDQVFHAILKKQEVQLLVHSYRNELGGYDRDMTSFQTFLMNRISDRKGAPKADKRILDHINKEILGNTASLAGIFETIESPNENEDEIAKAVKRHYENLFGRMRDPQSNIRYIDFVSDDDINAPIVHHQRRQLSVPHGQVPDISNKLNDIQALLVIYAKDKGYKFYLTEHHVSNRIPLPNALLLRRPKEFLYSSGVHAKHQDWHQLRSGWIYSCLVVLFCDESNEEKIVQLKGTLHQTRAHRCAFDKPSLSEIMKLIDDTFIQHSAQWVPAHQEEQLILDNGEEDMKEDVTENDVIELGPLEIEDAPPQTPIVPPVEYKKIGLFDLPVKTSDEIKFLANLISSFFPGGNVEIKTKRDFIPFWIKLCLLDQSKFFDTLIPGWRQINQMEQCQSMLGIQHRKQPEQEYLAVIKKMQGEGKLEKWVADNIGHLRDINPDVKSSSMNDVEFIEAIKIKLTQQHDEVSGLARNFLNKDLGAQDKLAWPENIHHELKQKTFYLLDEPDEKSIEANLNFLSKLLLRDKVTILPNAPESEALDFESLDIMLHYALEHGRETCTSSFEALRNPWLLVAQGLVRLGGDPLPWMERHLEAPDSLNNFFMMAQLTQSILTTLVCRSKFSGESGVMLGVAWDDLFRAIHAFSTRLYEYSESNTSAFWEVMWPVIEFFGVADTDHFVTERIAIYWSVLSLARNCLNKQSRGGLAKEFSDEIGKLKSQLQKFKERLGSGVFPGTNRGSKSVQDLRVVIKELELSLIRMAACREEKVIFDVTGIEGVEGRRAYKAHIEQEDNIILHERVDVAEQKADASKKEADAAKKETDAAKKETDAA